MPDELLRLLIANEEVDRAAVRYALDAASLRVQVEEAETCAQAIAALTEREFDCALLEAHLPDGNALGVLRRIRQAGIETPVVILTGQGDEMLAVELMKAGAADYLSRSRMSPDSLARSLRTVLRLDRAQRQARRAESARRETDQALETLIQSAPLGIVVLDVNGTVRLWNPAAEKIFGWRAAEVLGRPYPAVPEDRRRPSRAVGGRVLAGETVMGVESRRLRKDGTSIVVSASVAPLRDAQGRVDRVIAVLADVTARRRVEEAQQLLADAGDVLSASLDYQTTLANVARLVVPRLADFCTVDLQDESGAIRRVETIHADPDEAESARDLDRRYPTDPQAPHGPALVLRTGRPQLISQVTDSLLAAVAQDEAHLMLLRRADIQSVVCVPLIARGRTLGALTLLSTKPDRRYDGADLALAEQIAQRAALAVDNARLFEVMQARAEREAVVNALGQALRSSLNAEEIIQAATNEVGRALRVGRCLWAWINPARDGFDIAPEQYVAPGVQPRAGRPRFLDFPSDFLARWAGGEPLLVSDFQQDVQVVRSTYYRQMRESSTDVRALAACPVFFRGQWEGLFVVHQTDGPRQWTPDEVALLARVADMLAPALDNARRYAREHRVADRLQAAFLPNLPDQLGPLDLATVYKPGLAESQVGGDFYDAFPLPDGRVGLVIADVSGKGLSAAVLTATVKFSLRAFASEVAAPGLALTRLNRTLRVEASNMGEHFVTLFYGVFDPATGRLTYASAGHETQLIKRAEGGTVPLRSTGPILGVAEHRFGQRQERLECGDALILYTDGMTEARSPATRELLDVSGIERLLAKIGSDAGAGALAARLERLAMDWTDGRPHDDLALLVARRAVTADASAASLRTNFPPPLAPLIVEEEDMEEAPEEDLLFQFSLPSRPEYATEVRQAVAHWMNTLGFARGEVEDFQTAVTEAVMNAVRHGSSGDEADTYGVAAYHLANRALAVDVFDSGPGYQWDAIPPMPGPDADFGRGLPLMQALVDGIERIPTNRGLRLRLIKRRPPAK